MKSIGISREEVALRILCAFITRNGIHPSAVVHDDVRAALAAADRFQEAASEDDEDDE